MTAPRPGIERQKSYIVENTGMLDHETKISILSLISMEIETVGSVLKEDPRGVDIDLDTLAVENEELLGHIYNIVRARHTILNTPATSRGGGGGVT